MTMIIRPGFAQGLEEELPSSLPQGFPYFATDTRVLYIGRGETQPPISVRSSYEENHDQRLQTAEQWIQETSDRLDLRLGNIGSYVVDDTLIDDGHLPVFNEMESKFQFIDPKVIFNDSIVNDIYKQKTLFDITASLSDPHQIYLTIPYTTNFNRHPIEILKFFPEKDNVILTASTFTNDDADDFFANDYLTIGDGLSIRKSYQRPSTSTSETNSIYESSPILRDKFNHISSITLGSIGTYDSFLVKIGDRHYRFENNEWVDVNVTYPELLDLLNQGMSDRALLTNYTPINRIRLKEERALSSGKEFRFTFDRSKYQKIKQAEVIE